jgi:hypothetical protein
MSVGEAPPECRRLLEAFGYQWNEELRTWEGSVAGDTISQDTVAAWTLDQAREFLTREAAKTA